MSATLTNFTQSLEVNHIASSILANWIPPTLTQPHRACPHYNTPFSTRFFWILPVFCDYAQHAQCLILINLENMSSNAYMPSLDTFLELMKSPSKPAYNICRTIWKHTCVHIKILRNHTQLHICFYLKFYQEVSVRFNNCHFVAYVSNSLHISKIHTFTTLNRDDL